MPSPSNALHFFESATSFIFVKSLLGDANAEENGWRDYKGASFFNDPSRNPDDINQWIKKTFAEYLSAFANTSGGVLVWGIETTGRIPTKLSLVPDCQALAEKLNNWSNNATEPHVAGVINRAISDGKKKSGVVLTYIPESDFKPHQAKWGERTCFIRNQESSFPCPPALLRSLFFPRFFPRISGTVTLNTRDDQTQGLVARFTVEVSNGGEATAESMIMGFRFENAEGRTVGADSLWTQVGNTLAVRAGLDLPPNFNHPVAIKVRAVVKALPLKFYIYVFAHNTPMHYAELVYDGRELDEARDSRSISRKFVSQPFRPST